MAVKKTENLTEKKSTVKKTGTSTNRVAKKNTETSKNGKTAAGVANGVKKTSRKISPARKKRVSAKKKSMRLMPLIAGAAIGGIFMFLMMIFVIPFTKDLVETFSVGKAARLEKKLQTEDGSVAENKNKPQSKQETQTQQQQVTAQPAVPQQKVQPKTKEDTQPQVTQQPQPQPQTKEQSKTQTSQPQTKEQPKTQIQQQPQQAVATQPKTQLQATSTQIASAKPDRMQQPTTQKSSESTLAATIPLAVRGAKLVFVFDDGGQNMSQLESFVTLPFPITVAVLPRLSYSVEAAKRVRSSGNEVMLHQPMQAINIKVNPGPGAILPEMSVDEIKATVKANISEIAPIAGVNNHEGSLISEDEFKMMAVLETIKSNGIFYLDSRTTSQTRVPQAAMELGMGYYERNVFLDNTKKREDILTEIRKGLDVANKTGCAIMIGHIWSSDVLPGILRELYPILTSKGYTFSTVSKSGSMIWS